MKNKKFFTYLLIILLLQACGGGSSGTGAENGVKVNKVSGTVKNESNEPVKGAEVKIEGQEQTVTTDENGNFSIDINNPENLEVDENNDEVVLEFNIDNKNYITSTQLNVPAYNTVADVNLVVKKEDRNSTSNIDKIEAENKEDSSSTNEQTEETEQTNVPCNYDSGIVCGENGITYDNECIAYYDNTKVASSGYCLFKPVAGNCGEYNPVCGADGINYNNSCEANYYHTIILDNNPCFFVY